jgi:hypothetical protein
MKLMIALPLMVLGLQAHAQTSTAPTGSGPDWCSNHPGECAAMSKDMQDRCNNNPSECAQIKQKLQADCANNAAGCANVKSRLQANQAAVQNFNASNPNAAAVEANAGQRMANREERRTQRRQKFRQGQAGSSGSTTPQQ